MDPATLIAGAVAAGAAAAVKETASRAVKDAYAGLVTIIKDAYKAHPHVADSVEHLAKRPEDSTRKAGLENDLKGAAAEKGEEERLVAAATTLVKAVEAHDPSAARAVGVDIGLLSAATLSFKRVRSPEHGTAVRIGEAKIGGVASFEDIGGSSPPKI